ncbi:O-methyltransferase [Trichinella spiralis]|uniref:O-methyltransferase n=1 Tax=Trichinella spiralis TaxID=6334 RepID=UPI0001EFDFBD|nr:O-methyltransferase [Trichinella spiralis]
MQIFILFISADKWGYCRFFIAWAEGNAKFGRNLSSNCGIMGYVVSLASNVCKIFHKKLKICIFNYTTGVSADGALS